MAAGGEPLISGRLDSPLCEALVFSDDDRASAGNAR